MKRTENLRKNALNNQLISFGSATVESRSVMKVEKSLPRSPRKEREVITKLASKFQVRIEFREKVGRKKNVLSEREVDWVMTFLN